MLYSPKLHTCVVVFDCIFILQLQENQISSFLINLNEGQTLKTGKQSSKNLCLVLWEDLFVALLISLPVQIHGQGL